MEDYGLILLDCFKRINRTKGADLLFLHSMLDRLCKTLSIEEIKLVDDVWEKVT